MLELDNKHEITLSDSLVIRYGDTIRIIMLIKYFNVNISKMNKQQLKETTLFNVSASPAYAVTHGDIKTPSLEARQMF